MIDSHDPERLDNIDQVHSVLKEINADEVPQLEVYNKIDLLHGVEPKIQRDDSGRPVRVWVSAVNGDGTDLLQEAIKELLSDDILQGQLTLRPEQGRVRARLYKLGAIQSESCLECGDILLNIRLPRPDYERLAKQEGLNDSSFIVG